MKKIIRYGVNGIVRTGISISGIMLGVGMAKLHFEAISLKSFKSDNPNPTAKQIYENSGIISQYMMQNDCKINSETLETSFGTPEIINCITKDFNEVSGLTVTLIAPAAIILAFCMKMMPKSLAYFQIGYRELTKSDDLVLTEKDFEAYRKANSPKL